MSTTIWSHWGGSYEKKHLREETHTHTHARVHTHRQLGEETHRHIHRGNTQPERDRDRERTMGLQPPVPEDLPFCCLALPDLGTFDVALAAAGHTARLQYTYPSTHWAFLGRTETEFRLTTINSSFRGPGPSG